jgi:hypothetical protein
MDTHHHTVSVRVKSVLDSLDDDGHAACDADGGAGAAADNMMDADDLDEAGAAGGDNGAGAASLGAAGPSAVPGSNASLRHGIEQGAMGGGGVCVCVRVCVRAGMGVGCGTVQGNAQASRINSPS